MTHLSPPNLKELPPHHHPRSPPGLHRAGPLGPGEVAAKMLERAESALPQLRPLFVVCTGE